MTGKFRVEEKDYRNFVNAQAIDAALQILAKTHDWYIPNDLKEKYSEAKTTLYEVRDEIKTEMGLEVIV